MNNDARGIVGPLVDTGASSTKSHQPNRNPAPVFFSPPPEMAGRDDTHVHAHARRVCTQFDHTFYKIKYVSPLFTPDARERAGERGEYYRLLFPSLSKHDVT